MTCCTNGLAAYSMSLPPGGGCGGVSPRWGVHLGAGCQGFKTEITPRQGCTLQPTKDERERPIIGGEPQGCV